MIGPTDLLHPSPTPHFKTFHVFLIYCPKRPSFSTIQNHAPNVALLHKVRKINFSSFKAGGADFVVVTTVFQQYQTPTTTANST
jgi:hypothetical protein